MEIVFLWVFSGKRGTRAVPVGVAAKALPVVIAREQRQLAAVGVVAPARPQPSPVDVAKRS
jgi:hypothetical protein